jgi:nucleotidyltransferase/DNA polymerase involved in DNA repair
MRLLHLAWPHLALRLARGRDPSIPAAGPLILGGRPWDDGVVLDASPEAAALGVRRGIPLGQAHRLAPEAVFLPPDPLAAAAAVEAALDALAAFSPGIAGATDPADRAFGSLEVQVDGLEALWGPEPVLVGKVRAALAPLLPGTPRAGIAGTRFAAALAAATGPGPSAVPAVLVPPGDDAAFLAPFPAGALAREPEVRGRLARFGLMTIGAVAALPRSALVARFGVEEGARLHDRANGVETDPFRPRRAPERLALGIALDEPVADLEALRFVLRRLATALGAQLDARGEGAGRARLVATLDPTFAPGRLPLPGTDLPMLELVQRLPEPTADPEAIERLLLERLEREPPALPVARLELELADVVPAAGQQLALFTPQANAASRLGWQLARLAVRFGEGSVGRVALADPEARLPETRWTWHPVAADGATPAPRPVP